VSPSAAGRTPATDSVHTPLAAVTVTEVGAHGRGTTLHRSGTRSEATYEVRNNSTRAIASPNGGLDIFPCEPDTVVSCDPTGDNVADHFTVQRYDGHRWVAAGPGNGSSVRVLSTALPAGATARVRVRLRVAPEAALGTDIDRVNVGRAAAGTMPGAKTSSFDSSTQTYAIARRRRRPAPTAPTRGRSGPVRAESARPPASTRPSLPTSPSAATPSVTGARAPGWGPPRGS
jgi:hypothetical protein